MIDRKPVSKDTRLRYTNKMVINVHNQKTQKLKSNKLLFIQFCRRVWHGSILICHPIWWSIMETMPFWKSIPGQANDRGLVEVPVDEISWYW